MILRVGYRPAAERYATLPHIVPANDANPTLVFDHALGICLVRTAPPSSKTSNQTIHFFCKVAQSISGVQ